MLLSNNNHNKCGGKPWVYSASSGLLLLLFSFAASIVSGRYASEMAGNQPVSDLLLDHLPLLDVNLVHIYVASSFWLAILFVCIRNYQYLPFAMKTTALFLLVRSVFVMLTHLGPPQNLLKLPSDLTSLYIYQGDLFFSGHVGGPFLFALIFWHRKPLRFICLGASVFFSVIVLLGKLHYSIDVFAAFFIAHSVFYVSKKLFNDDFQFLH